MRDQNKERGAVDLENLSERTKSTTDKYTYNIRVVAQKEGRLSGCSPTCKKRPKVSSAELQQTQDALRKALELQKTLEAELAQASGSRDLTYSSMHVVNCQDPLLTVSFNEDKSMAGSSEPAIDVGMQSMPAAQDVGLCRCEKGPCEHLLSSNGCKFGNGCKYCHVHPQKQQERRGRPTKSVRDRMKALHAEPVPPFHNDLPSWSKDESSCLLERKR